MGVVIIFLFIVYVLLSVGFVKLVGRFTKGKKLYKYLAVAVCILLPTWNIVLGALIYFPSCLFFPKVAIYETAETEGIYYEGTNNYIYEFDRENQPISERIHVGFANWILKEGYSYIESKVIKQKSISSLKYTAMPATYYRCIPRFEGKESMPGTVFTSCNQVDQIISRYAVRVKTVNIGSVEMNTKKAIDTSNNKVMGEYSQVALELSFPFFSWWYKYDGSPARITCPWDKHNQQYGFSRFYTFEYKVLKPKR